MFNQTFTVIDIWILEIEANIPGAIIEPGGDVLADNRVIGLYFALIKLQGIILQLIDCDEDNSEFLKSTIVNSGINALIIYSNKLQDSIKNIVQTFGEK